VWLRLSLLTAGNFTLKIQLPQWPVFELEMSLPQQS